MFPGLPQSFWLRTPWKAMESNVWYGVSNPFGDPYIQPIQESTGQSKISQHSISKLGNDWSRTAAAAELTWRGCKSSRINHRLWQNSHRIIRWNKIQHFIARKYTERSRCLLLPGHHYYKWWQVREGNTITSNKTPHSKCLLDQNMKKF